MHMCMLRVCCMCVCVCMCEVIKYICKKERDASMSIAVVAYLMFVGKVLCVHCYETTTTITCAYVYCVDLCSSPFVYIKGLVIFFYRVSLINPLLALSGAVSSPAVTLTRTHTLSLLPNHYSKYTPVSICSPFLFQKLDVNWIICLFCVRKGQLM
jgi:hypothetical protein